MTAASLDSGVILVVEPSECLSCGSPVFDLMDAVRRCDIPLISRLARHATGAELKAMLAARIDTAVVEVDAPTGGLFVVRAGLVVREVVDRMQLADVADAVRASCDPYALDQAVEGESGG